MTRKEAVIKYNTKWWLKATSEEIALFQLQEKRMCCPFDIFHKVTEDILNRPVFTHEFANPEKLLQEWGNTA